MDLLRLYTNVYSALRKRRFVPDRLLSPLRFLIRKNANIVLPTYFRHNPIEKMGNNQSMIIVSLTSFPARINYVWLTIHSLLRQSLMPQKVILWLSQEQFPDKSGIPASLWDLEGDRFSIRVMPGDIRSHKKYYYAFKEYPDSIVVTVDDDVYYSPDMLKEMYKDHLLYPSNIIANETRQFYFVGERLAPYLKWRKSIDSYVDDNLVQIGFGGVLYPPHSLHADVFRQDLFMKLAPEADDLWLNYMVRRNGVKVMQSGFRKVLLPILIDNNVQLTTTNWHDNKNDNQIEAIRQYFIEIDGIDSYQ